MSALERLFISLPGELVIRAIDGSKVREAGHPAFTRLDAGIGPPFGRKVRLSLMIAACSELVRCERPPWFSARTQGPQQPGVFFSRLAGSAAEA
jgi:hypothetical protein